MHVKRYKQLQLFLQDNVAFKRAFLCISMSSSVNFSFLIIVIQYSLTMKYFFGYNSIYRYEQLDIKSILFLKSETKNLYTSFSINIFSWKLVFRSTILAFYCFNEKLSLMHKHIIFLFAINAEHSHFFQLSFNPFSYVFIIFNIKT